MDEELRNDKRWWIRDSTIASFRSCQRINRGNEIGNADISERPRDRCNRPGSREIVRCCIVRVVERGGGLRIYVSVKSRWNIKLTFPVHWTYISARSPWYIPVRQLRCNDPRPRSIRIPSRVVSITVIRWNSLSAFLPSPNPFRPALNADLKGRIGNNRWNASRVSWKRTEPIHACVTFAIFGRRNSFRPRDERMKGILFLVW